MTDTPDLVASVPMFDGVAATDISAAMARLAGKVRRTPLVSSASLSRSDAAPVYLKLEHLQHTGSFKIRGATNALLQLDSAQRSAGVVAVSTGNHGRAVAAAAQALGIGCTVCMSELVPENKVAAIKALGATVEIIGQSQDEAQRHAEDLARAGRVFLPPFDHPHVIAGQGTIGLEIMEREPDITELLVPLSGGGLIAGIAVAAKSINPDLRVIGLSMDRGPAMIESQQAGKPVQVTEQASLADSLGGGIGLDNRFTFPAVRDLVDQLIVVTEAEIAAGIAHLYRQECQRVEGAAAVGVAAILHGHYTPTGPTGLIISGGNIDPAAHDQVLQTVHASEVAE